MRDRQCLHAPHVLINRCGPLDRLSNGRRAATTAHRYLGSRGLASARAPLSVLIITAIAPSTGQTLEKIEDYTAFPSKEDFRLLWRLLGDKDEQEAFFLRITGPDDYRYEGADLGILILRGRSMTSEFMLNDRAQAWINGIVSSYQAKPLPPAEAVPQAGAFKIL